MTHTQWLHILWSLDCMKIYIILYYMTYITWLILYDSYSMKLILYEDIYMVQRDLTLEKKVFKYFFLFNKLFFLLIIFKSPQFIESILQQVMIARYSLHWTALCIYKFQINKFPYCFIWLLFIWGERFGWNTHTFATINSMIVRTGSIPTYI